MIPATHREHSRPGVDVDATELIKLRPAAQTLTLKHRVERQASAPRHGQRHSRVRGRGVDFLESRSYQPGDDIRHMDWRVTARSGKPHTKIYQEERERPVIVVIDYNSTMYFGTRGAFKSVAAARLAALIGWATVDNGDRTGAFLFGAGRHRELPPTGGRRGVLTLIRQLVVWTQPPADGDFSGASISYLGEALRRLRRVARPGSLVFLISDFYALDDDTDHQLTRLREHNDLIAVQVIDPLEQSPPPPGRYSVSDGHRQRVLDTHSEQVRRDYQARYARHQTRISELARRRNVPLITLQTDADPAAALRRGLNT